MSETSESQSNSVLETCCIASDFSQRYGKCRQSCLQRHLQSFLTGKRLDGILINNDSLRGGDNIADTVIATLTNQKLETKAPPKVHPEDLAISQLGRDNYNEFKSQMIRCEYNCAEINLNLLN